MSNIEVLVQSGNDLYYPIVEDDITWETQRKGSPGIVSLNIYKDDILNFSEGNAVRIKYNNVNVFYGFIFEFKKSKDNNYKIVAYDQLRYFKNKDTYVYENKTASEIIKMLANDFNLKVGTIEDTKLKIPSRIEEDKTLFDIVQNALDITLENNKEMYILYDDFGQLTLKNLNSMKLDALIDGDIIEDFDYSSNINNSYNKIKLSKENKDANTREIYIAQDTSKINSWGVLQHFENIDENSDGKNKADSLLKLYNQKTKTLNVKNVLGDLRVRAGSIIAVVLDLGDMKIQNHMIVDKAKHTFTNNLHTMDLALVGGEFVSSIASSSSSSSSNNKSSSDSGSNSNTKVVGKDVSALFTAYYPANTALQGGMYDAQGNRLNPNNKTCAAPRSVPFGTKIKVENTGTSQDGQIYTVTDRGGAITIKDGIYHFDLLMSSKNECYSFGKKGGKATILTEVQNTSSSSNKSSKLISVAKSKLGKPYVWGATGPNSFDCSGLTSWCYKQIGISIPRTSREQGKAGKSVSKANLQPGDLVFFNNPISHVGLYIGNDQMIHAPSPGQTVCIVSMNNSYFKGRYNTARRFL